MRSSVKCSANRRKQDFGNGSRTPNLSPSLYTTDVVLARQQDLTCSRESPGQSGEWTGVRALALLWLRGSRMGSRAEGVWLRREGKQVRTLWMGTKAHVTTLNRTTTVQRGSLRTPPVQWVDPGTGQPQSLRREWSLLLWN